jgi:hypothetical protein
MAITQATKEAIWLSRLENEVYIYLHRNDERPRRKAPISIYADNQSSISLTKNAEHHSRTKHIDIQYHFVRDAVVDEQIKPVFCSTGEQVADINTKALPATKFNSFVKKMGLKEATSS